MTELSLCSWALVLMPTLGLRLMDVNTLDSDNPWRSGLMTSEKCDALLNSRVFAQIWNQYPKEWYAKPVHSPGCWTQYNATGAHNHSRDFATKLLDSRSCARNWTVGHHRHNFTQHPPALLGLDEDMWKYCSGRKHFKNEQEPELIASCSKRNQNLIRVDLDLARYDQCMDAQWVICAAKELLPGQGEAGLHFATAPKNLNMKLWGLWHDVKENERTFDSNPTFIAEVCLLNRFCRNGHQLFSLDYLEVFHCDFDDDRVRSWATTLGQVEKPDNGAARSQFVDMILVASLGFYLSVW
eukprot:gnl/TRDRNA2_/TRDRNA2_174432_c0_seq2.p1 gnl/TRDRNA2_/TRDRNA2_174432_c0~~gnl/TRDRNA2_/TRDRNA2_174432_c0_seq2.p1  ORF type:complete len:297 (+),score=19.78 gnl/TRDRNA2_/TRDRNA2_174432_c0_seq2:67-957(+)